MKKDKYLVAVSGGPDSMAILHQLVSRGQEVAVAHVNYHQRDSSNRDQEIVESFCNDNNLVFYVLDAPKELKGNFQAMARELRYDWMNQLCMEHNYAGIITGHHLDDLIETYLIQKERNNIVKHYGLSYKIKYHNTEIVREGLTQTKEQLVIYCEDNNITYGIDESNEDDKYQRNKIRKEVNKMSLKEKKDIIKEIDSKNTLNNVLFKQVDKLYEQHVNKNRINREVFNCDNNEVLLRALYKFLEDNKYPQVLITSGLLNEIISFNKKVTQGNATINLKDKFIIKNKSGEFYILQNV